jgi:hypothetical protein
MEGFKMFTLENTEGFDQATLDKMNDEVMDLMTTQYLMTLSQARVWAEEKVLAKYRGA